MPLADSPNVDADDLKDDKALGAAAAAQESEPPAPVFLQQKSRYESISHFLSLRPEHRPQYNDLEAPVDAAR